MHQTVITEYNDTCLLVAYLTNPCIHICGRICMHVIRCYDIVFTVATTATYTVDGIMGLHFGVWAQFCC